MTGQFYAYVSIAGENSIAIFKMNPETGALESMASLDVGGAPGSLAVGPERRFLYAAIRSTGSVSTFRIDPATGGLSAIGTARVVDNPVYIVTDKTGRYLLTSYYGAGKAAIYPINRDGIVRGEATEIVTTDKNPHSILMDASNRFVFVPNTGADAILQFRLDTESGKLIPGTPPRVTTRKGSGPRHVFFHPSKNFVYFVNETNSSVTAYNMNESTGSITPFQTISTLPAGFTGSNSCADIEVHPSGRFLYASNRGHDSIALYAIDPSDGRLTSLGQQPTEQTPRSFNIDPAGNFLFAAGQSSGRLASYRIDPDSGKLRPLAVYPVGKGPSWVLVARMPE